MVTRGNNNGGSPHTDLHVLVVDAESVLLVGHTVAVSDIALTVLRVSVGHRDNVGDVVSGKELDVEVIQPSRGGPEPGGDVLGNTDTVLNIELRLVKRDGGFEATNNVLRLDVGEEGVLLENGQILGAERGNVQESGKTQGGVVEGDLRGVLHVVQLPDNLRADLALLVVLLGVSLGVDLHVPVLVGGETRQSTDHHDDLVQNIRDGVLHKTVNNTTSLIVLELVELGLEHSGNIDGTSLDLEEVTMAFVVHTVTAQPSSNSQIVSHRGGDGVLDLLLGPPLTINLRVRVGDTLQLLFEEIQVAGVHLDGELDEVLGVGLTNETPALGDIINRVPDIEFFGGHKAQAEHHKQSNALHDGIENKKKKILIVVAKAP